MNVLQPPRLEKSAVCPYFKERQSRNNSFLADNISALELDVLLSEGWRKFGPYFFRPECLSCKDCLPLRVCVQDFKTTKSIRRILRKNQDLTYHVDLLRYSAELYELYTKHSLSRFGKVESLENFIIGLCYPFQTSRLFKYYLGKKLVAAGFLDQSEKALSSVYFIWDPELKDRSLGHFGSLSEIFYAKQLGLEHYYLGYWIKDHAAMNYKAMFAPHEIYQWDEKLWKKV